MATLRPCTVRAGLSFSRVLARMKIRHSGTTRAQTLKADPKRRQRPRPPPYRIKNIQKEGP